MHWVARGSNEIAQNINTVATTAQSATEGATETRSAAENLTSIAMQLQNLVGQFKYESNDLSEEAQ